MEIILSNEKRTEILQLPIIPEALEVSFPHNNEVFSTVDGGDINLIGRPGLKSISLNSWFPSKEYSFAKSPVLMSEGKEFFVKYKRIREPIRVVIINKNGYTFHNELYVIEEFTFGYDRAGDMTYTVNLKQFVPSRVSI